MSVSAAPVPPPHSSLVPGDRGSDGEVVHSVRRVAPPLGLKLPQKPTKVFRLPDFPPPLAYHYVQNYYSDMAASLGKAIGSAPPEESALLAR